MRTAQMTQPDMEPEDSQQAKKPPKSMAHTRTAQFAEPPEAPEPTSAPAEGADTEKKDKKPSRSMAHMRTAMVVEPEMESGEQAPDVIRPEKSDPTCMLLGGVVLAT